MAKGKTAAAEESPVIVSVHLNDQADGCYGLVLREDGTYDAYGDDEMVKILVDEYVKK